MMSGKCFWVWVLLFSGVLIAHAEGNEREYVILVHGGAGAVKTLKGNPDKEALYYAALDSALVLGNAILGGGGKGVDAVVAVVSFLEDCPLFNAGVGATVTAEGTFELDASVMDGKDLDAGAVAGVKLLKNPIRVARLVKDLSPHVMLSGSGAEEFAALNGAQMVEDNRYFATPETMKWIDELKEKAKKNGTVGCVVLDSEGNLAAGTSTGGMRNKRWGRIGDSPVIGAGTYADNASCAVSCTGHGEYFIRHAVAFNLCARYKYLNESVSEAGDYILHKELSPEAGEGGLIALDRKGDFALPFNTEGMFRGYLYKEKENPVPVKQVGIYQEMVTP